MVEITGIYGAGVYPDGTLEPICANRVKKGMQLLMDKETEVVVMLGTPGPYMRLYALKKFPYIDKSKILVEGKGRSAVEETKNFKENFIQPYGYKIIGKVSQAWHFPRIKMIDSFFFSSNYKIEYFEAEDGRNEEEIRKSIVKEKFAFLRDYVRLKIPFGTSSKMEKLLELTEKLYNL
ncbi:MAG: ElyC/SanA/YdcF family protein [Candidatus Aenigmatarchaeota archaeon]